MLFTTEKATQTQMRLSKNVAIAGILPCSEKEKSTYAHKPATINYFNEKYDLKVPRTGFVDIYAPGLNGWDVKEHLNKASSTCCYCTLGWDVIPVFPWTTSKLVLLDWDALANSARVSERGCLQRALSGFLTLFVFRSFIELILTDPSARTFYQTAKEHHALWLALIGFAGWNVLLEGCCGNVIIRE